MDKIFKQIFSYILKASSSLLTFYTKHQWYQFVLVIPMIIVAFIYGRSQQDKELETVLTKLNNTDQYKLDISAQRSKVHVRLTKIKQYLKMQIIFLGCFVVFTLTYYLTSASSLLEIGLHFFLVLYAVIVVIIGITFILRKWYQSKTQSLGKQMQNVFEQEKKDVEIIQKHLGQKIVKKLKARFLKNLRQDQEIKNKQPCRNKNCVTKIKIYKQSFEFFDNIIKGMINYDWCDFCKNQLEAKTPNLSSTTLQEIKMTNQSLDGMKRLFNNLLKFYNDKISDLEKVCKNQCCKQFYQVLKPLSEDHYKEYKMFDEQLKLLK